jgi:murein DD-endopeptidase MepM/ murein hydrolase activator NlpD
MDFSMDRLVHDITLNQFRTNNKICIGAGVGTQVKAAADGVVRNVSRTRELGNTIVIEHGNGWFTTYSQLQDGILVEAGDVVVEGQVIGGVGEPSIYYTLLGSHLAFKVVKDDLPVNPSIVLAMN